MIIELFSSPDVLSIVLQKNLRFTTFLLFSRESILKCFSLQLYDESLCNKNELIGGFLTTCEGNELWLTLVYM